MTHTTVNGWLQAKAIARSAQVQRVATRQVNLILKMLNGHVFPELTLRVERGLGRIASRGRAKVADVRKSVGYKKTVNGVKETAKNGYATLRTTLTNGMTELAASEAAWQLGALDGVLGPVSRSVRLTPADGNRVRQFVSSQPFGEGGVLSSYVKDLSRKTVGAIERQMALGLGQGEDVMQIVRRIRGTQERGFKDGVFHGSRRDAEGLVRTATNHAANVGRMETAAANADIVKGIVWDAALDLRTCPTCGALEEESRANPYPIDSGPRPPAHPRCRCAALPVLKSYRELGIDRDEAPEGFRASMDGQVPASTTFEEFLRGKSADDQDIVLGATRGRMFREGKADLLDMIDQRNRPLSVPELEKLTA